jgi:trigger factor
MNPPTAPLPDLTTLHLPPLKATALTEQLLLGCFEHLRRKAARVVRRPRGARIAEGDEVLVDFLGYIDGRILPLAAASSCLLRAGDGPPFSSLGEQLTGLRAGHSAQLRATYPVDFTVPWLAGRTAVVLVEVVEARSVTLAPLDSPSDVAALGLGETLDDVMSRLAWHVQRELERVDAQRQRREVAEALVRHTPFELPDAFLERALERVWLDADGKVLARFGLGDRELQKACDGFRRNERIRAQVERDVKAALLVGRLLSGGAVALEASDLVPLTVSAAAALGATTEGALGERLGGEAPSHSALAGELVLAAALDKIAELAVTRCAR